MTIGMPLRRSRSLILPPGIPLWKVSLMPVHRLLCSSMVMRLSLEISQAAPGNPAYQMIGMSKVLRTLLTFILASAPATCPLMESTLL